MDFNCDEVVLVWAAWFTDGFLTDGCEGLSGCVCDASEDLCITLAMCICVRSDRLCKGRATYGVGYHGGEDCRFMSAGHSSMSDSRNHTWSCGIVRVIPPG